MQERTVSQVISHPGYTTTKYNDIALLKVSRGFNLDIYARPACLQTEKNIPYKKAIASGWGKVEYSGEGSNDLLKVVLEFFSLDKCNATYRRDIIVPNSNLKDGIVDDLQICAGSSKELKDTCQVIKYIFNDFFYGCYVSISGRFWWSSSGIPRRVSRCEMYVRYSRSDLFWKIVRFGEERSGGVYQSIGLHQVDRRHCLAELNVIFFTFTWRWMW